MRHLAQLLSDNKISTKKLYQNNFVHPSESGVAMSGPFNARREQNYHCKRKSLKSQWCNDNSKVSMLSKLSLYVLLTLCTVPIVGDWTKFAKLKVFFQLFLVSCNNNILLLQGNHGKCHIAYITLLRKGQRKETKMFSSINQVRNFVQHQTDRYLKI